MIEESAYERDRAQQGLDSHSLNFDQILRQPALIGFLSGILLSQFQILFEHSHHLQLAITSLSLTIIFLALSRFYLDTLGVISWRLSERWSIIWMKFLNFFIFTSMLLTTTFFVHWLQATVQTNLLQTHEAFAFVCLSLLSLFYVSDLQFHITNS